MKRATRVLFFLFLIALFGCKASDNGTGVNPDNLSAPQITGMNPGLVNPGMENIEGRIYGSHLTGVLAVTLGEGIFLQQYSQISESELYIFFSVSREAGPGKRTITVTNSGGVASSDKFFTIGDHAVPLATFIIRPPRGIKGDIFRFDASKSLATGGIADYEWHPNDGTHPHGKIVDHKFTRAGNFEVRLTVRDNSGASAETFRLVEVAASRSPIARFTMSPNTGDINTVFRFDATGSHDPDGRISKYYWGFGDGTTGQGATISHKFLRSGDFPVTMTAIDASGESAVITQIARIGGTGGGGTPPPPPTGGTECTSPSPKSETRFGTILSVDTAAHQAVVQFSSASSCATAFYRCGDLKDGYFNGAPERWFGAICRMWDLGNNTFRIQLGGGPDFPPPVPDSTAWIHWQDCSGVSNYCN